MGIDPATHVLSWACMKVVVFGKGGQLGRELVRVFTSRGHNVSAFERAEVDVTDAARVEQTVAFENPDMVLNATAYNMVDVAEKEPEAAFAGNALAVRNLAVACRQTDARLVHFSTDYVFDGSLGRPYVEEDPPHPLGAYAVSKLAGEFYAQAYVDNPLIIRTSGVFGPGGLHTARGNFVEVMLRLGNSGQPIRVVEDFVASPTYAPELAERTAQMVDGKLTGIFHAGGGVAISWYEYAKLIFEVAGLSPEIKATNEREHRTAARRPKFSALSNGKMERCGVAPMPPMREVVQDYMARRRHEVAKA
jgi:dTDP-4-dehydrorhamnose reductase